MFNHPFKLQELKEDVLKKRRETTKKKQSPNKVIRAMIEVLDI